MANGIFTYILLIYIYMVIVGKYTVHGSLGNIFIYTLLQAGWLVGFTGDISFTTKKGPLPVNPRHVGKLSVETGAD